MRCSLDGDWGSGVETLGHRIEARVGGSSGEPVVRQLIRDGGGRRHDRAWATQSVHGEPADEAYQQHAADERQECGFPAAAFRRSVRILSNVKYRGLCVDSGISLV